MDTCEDPADVAVLSSPVAPWKGAPLRVIFAAEKPLDGELSLIAPDGNVAASSRGRHDGPPYVWFAEVDTPAVGTWHAKLVRPGAPAECSTVTREITVAGAEPPKPHATDGSLWPIRNAWNRETENLFSAWVEKLFDAPVEEAPSWKALHEVLRDRSRNVLFNHLGLREDQMGMVIRPDCADLPYFLRAYFAFKMGLPFGYSKCSRGGGGAAPTCHSWWNIQNLEPAHASPEAAAAPQQVASASEQPPSRGLLDMFHQQNPAGQAAPQATAVPRAAVGSPPRSSLGLAASFGQYVSRTVADAVHSGSGRTAANDDNTDYYPVPLTAETLRPGDGIRRSVWARSDAGAARAADERCGWSLHRRRRTARWHGLGEALLARQFPVRPGSRAW